MKLGDKKQAIGLGIGAVFAVGLLTKTAFGTIGNGSSNRPIVIRDIGSPLPKSARSSDSPSETPIPIKPSPGDQSANSANKGDLTTIKRDAFEVPARTSAFDGDKPRSRPNRESSRPTNQIRPEDPGYDSSDRMTGSLPGAESTTKPEGNDKSPLSVPSQKPVYTLRFDGFIEAGGSTGVVSMNGKTSSVEVGDLVGQGFRVQFISSEKITIRKGKLVKTIFIGQETHI